MDVLVRRIIIGVSRIREDLEHMSALIAFKQSEVFSTSSHADLISKDDDEKKRGHRGRTASYLTAPAQIPACGITAPGSSMALASHWR